MLIHRPSELGAIIEAARRARGLTQSELAGRLGVSRIWLGQIERGKSSARIDLVFRVLHELGVTLSADVSTNETPASSPQRHPPSDPIDIDDIADSGLTSAARTPRPIAKSKRGRR